MPRFSPLAAAAILVMALGLCACDSRSPRTQVRGGIASEIPRRPWGESGYKEYIPLELPVVEHARWVRPDERRLVVNMLVNGDLYFAGRMWPLASEEDSWASKEDSVGVSALNALRSELERRRDGTPDHAAPAGQPVSLMLQVDQWLGWVFVRDLVSVALEETIRVPRLHFAVDSRSTYCRVPRRLGHASHSRWDGFTVFRAHGPGLRSHGFTSVHG